MKLFLIILGLIALLALVGWLMHRLSVSRSKAASQREAEAEQERQDYIAGEKVRKDRAARVMTAEGDAAFRARQAEASPIKRTDRVTPAAMSKKVRRDQVDGHDADYVDFVEPTLADDLLGMRTPEDIWGSPEPEPTPAPSWRELPEGLRETPAEVSAPSVQAPAESTDRWTPSFDDTGRHEPVSAPDSTPTSSWGDSTSTSGSSSWTDSGTTGGTSGSSGSSWSDSGSTSSNTDSGGGSYGGSD